MGKVKQLWQDKINEVLQHFADGLITREEAAIKLSHLMSDADITYLLNEAEEQ